jgi:hypothetical protein
MICRMLKRGHKKLSQVQLNTFHKYASILVLGFIAVLVSFLFWRLMMPRMDFYNELWGPAYLLVQGKSPYNTASLNPVLPAVWFPMAIGFFFPLGWLPENLALQAWFFFNIIEICLVVYLVQGDRYSLYSTATLALMCFFFPFTLNHFNLGQFSITVMLSLILSAYFADKRRDWLAACLLALALSKPQLGILAMFGVSALYFRRNGFRGLVYFGSQTALTTLLMCLPLFIFHPAWIPDWFKSMQSNYAWLHPSLFSIFRQSFGGWGIIPWAAMLILALCASHQLWMKFPAHTAMLWSLGITTIITPYIWSWDFVLLLPIWMHTFTNSGWKRKVILLILYAVAWYGAAIIQAQVGSQNQSFWWVPILFIGTLALVADWKTSRFSAEYKVQGQSSDVHPYPGNKKNTISP